MSLTPEELESMKLRWKAQSGGWARTSALKLIAELERLRGPACTDEECPDYDGEHPYHQSEWVKAHEAGQAKVRALLSKADRDFATLRAQVCSHATGKHDEECDLVAGLTIDRDAYRTRLESAKWGVCAMTAPHTDARSRTLAKCADIARKHYPRAPKMGERR